MTITLDSISNARFMEDLYGKKKYKEIDENIFSKYSEIGENNLTNKDEKEENLFSTGKEEDDIILTQSDFSNNILRLMKNGFGLVEALAETRQQQYEDLFEKRMAENGGDPVEASAYARALLSSEPSDEEYHHLVSELAQDYESINTNISDKLQSVADKLKEKLESKNKKTSYSILDELENSKKENVDKSNNSGLNVNFDIQKLNYAKILEKQMQENLDFGEEKYSRSIIV